MIKAAAATTAMLCKQAFNLVHRSTVSDIIGERLTLPAVEALRNSSACSMVDIQAVLGHVKSCDNHFGYAEISKVSPLVFGWNGNAIESFIRQLDKAKLPATQQMPSSQFATPMITAIDYVNENVNGHPSLIHGGMTTIIANSTTSLLAAINAPRDAQVVLQTLNMDYRKPIRTGSFIKIHAWLYQKQESKYKAALQIYSLNDAILVEATSELVVSQ
ncbi:hypothetical protein LPJ78_000836 [Coemansia sp. RSA 989]|nr:hypothetical protein LPJ78_000836 [Coemansia sp. RSA 989]